MNSCRHSATGAATGTADRFRTASVWCWTSSRRFVRNGLPKNRWERASPRPTGSTGGWTLDDAVILCRELRALGCDYITVSSGGLSPAQRCPDRAKAIRCRWPPASAREVDIPVIAVGMIYRAAHAEKNNRRWSRGYGRARPAACCSTPHWAWRAAAELGAEVSFPPQYVRAYKSGWLQMLAAENGQSK